MANRIRSSSRRTSAPSSPVGSGQAVQSAAAGGPISPTAAASSPTAATSSASQRRRSAPTEVSAETRRAMIAEAAYLRAERRGFAPGHEEEDWLVAEKEVDALLSAGQGEPQ